jgi:hypothetical protein
MHLFQEKEVLDHRKIMQVKFLKTVANSQKDVILLQHLLMSVHRSA